MSYSKKTKSKHYQRVSEEKENSLDADCQNFNASGKELKSSIDTTAVPFRATEITVNT